jgi:hypothetical protein
MEDFYNNVIPATSFNNLIESGLNACRAKYKSVKKKSKSDMTEQRKYKDRLICKHNEIMSEPHK